MDTKQRSVMIDALLDELNGWSRENLLVLATTVRLEALAGLCDNDLQEMYLTMMKEEGLVEDNER